jgi:hypothetical protein
MIGTTLSRGEAAEQLVGLGDLVADQVVDVVLRLTFPYGQLGRETGIIVRVLDREGVFTRAASTMPGSPGRGPTTAPTTPRSATSTSTARSLASTQRAPARRQSLATGRVTSRALAGSSERPPSGSASTPAATP